MKKQKHVITRRDFLRAGAYTTLATVLGTKVMADEGANSERRSRIVLVRHPDALDGNWNPNPEVIQKMLDDGLKTLLEIDDTVEAWRKLIEPNGPVGVKTNVWSYLPTPRAVETAILRRVIDSGVPAGSISMDDRGARTTLANCTRLINARPLRTHHWSGIGGCLKNYIMFVALPFWYHSNACANLGRIWTLPIVKDKTRLNVLVVLQPLFHGRGAHHYNPKYVWDYRGILLSTDPVAADAIGVQLLSAKRRDYFGEDRPFPKLTHHVTYADIRHHVGVGDPKRIDLIKVGWKEGILI